MKKLLLSAFTMLLVASAASAVVLWDQSNLNALGDGTVNLASNGCSQISGNTRLHNTSDVTFSTTVAITSITIYETTGNVQAATQAYLWIGPKTGPFPTVPSDSLYNASRLVTITAAAPATVNGVPNVVAVTANVNRVLSAGDYWVSLTPRHNLGIYPYSWHIYTDGPIVGSPTRMIEACTVNTNWLTPLDPPGYDYSLKIVGDLPVPAAGTTWGRLKSFYR
jgi:hypothetical protein